MVLWWSLERQLFLSGIVNADNRGESVRKQCFLKEKAFGSGQKWRVVLDFWTAQHFSCIFVVFFLKKDFRWPLTEELFVFMGSRTKYTVWSRCTRAKNIFGNYCSEWWWTRRSRHRVGSEFWMRSAIFWIFAVQRLVALRRVRIFMNQNNKNCFIKTIQD